MYIVSSCNVFCTDSTNLFISETKDLFSLASATVNVGSKVREATALFTLLWFLLVFVLNSISLT